jgi:hypothetical protein
MYGWLIRRGLDSMIGFIAPYTFTTRDYRQHSAIAILHTFQFTVAYALRFSVFTSRILATDLSQSHSNFKSHMKSSWNGLIPFLQFLLNHLRQPSPELDSTTLDYCSILRRVFVPFYNPLVRTPWKTPSSIVKDACLLVRYLAMDVLLLSRELLLRECVYRVVA